MTFTCGLMPGRAMAPATAPVKSSMTSTLSSTLLATVLATFASLGSPGIVIADGVVLAPHRAVYDVKLARASSGSGVVDASGRMVYELTGSACEGYTQNMRFVTRMTNGEGSSQLNDLRSSSFEDSSGKSFRFNSNSYKDEQLGDTTQGDASREQGGVKVELTRPKKKTVTLASSIYYPVQHSVALLEAARSGKALFVGDLYDGSEKGEKIYSTTSAIGKRTAPGAPKSPTALKNGDVLDKLPSWPVSISYFEPNSDKKDSVPSYELSFRYFENGVSTKLMIDYGEFAIKGELTEITFLDAPKCNASGSGSGATGVQGKR